MKQDWSLSKKQVLLLVSAVIFNFIIYNGGRRIATDLYHYRFTTAIDERIPFLPWTVLIYWGCYLFWIFNYLLGVKYDKRNGCSFIGAHFIGEAVCFIFFILFPTTMDRPENFGHSIADCLVRLTYYYDAADNLFPSIHCFVSWLCWIGVRKNKHIPVWYQIVSLFIAILVCISTLTVKQHVLADVIAGIILAEVSYLLSGMLDK